MAKKAAKEKKNKVKRVKEVSKKVSISQLNSKEHGLEKEVSSDSFPEEQSKSMENQNRKRERITPSLPQTRVIEPEQENLQETAQAVNQARQAAQIRERNFSYEQQLQQTRRSYMSNNKYESVQDTSPEASVQRARQVRLPILRPAIANTEIFEQRGLDSKPSIDPRTDAVERSPAEEYTSNRKYEKAFQERQAKRRSELF